MKYGKQVHEEGIQARARVVPAKSPSPACTWGDTGVGRVETECTRVLGGSRGGGREGYNICIQPGPCALSGRLWL